MCASSGACALVCIARYQVFCQLCLLPGVYRISCDVALCILMTRGVQMFLHRLPDAGDDLVVQCCCMSALTGFCVVMWMMQH
jgi:hypothetical protein